MSAEPEDDARKSQRQLMRRQALGAGTGAAGALALGAYGVTRLAGGSTRAAAEIVLRARPTTVELGSRKAKTWAFDGRVPGHEVRLRQGKPVRIRVQNDLPEPTSVHWHGIRLRNPADGVPDFTQKAIEPGESFVYAFTPPRCRHLLLSQPRRHAARPRSMDPL